MLARGGHALAFVVGEIEEGADLVSRGRSDLDPNQATPHDIGSGGFLLWLGEIDTAIEQFQVALRLSPLDPSIFTAHSGLAWAHFMAGRNRGGLIVGGSYYPAATQFLGRTPYHDGMPCDVGTR